jgi:hypothetical protein
MNLLSSPSENNHSSDLMQSPKVIPSGYSHSFDVGIASQLGINAAIVYNHILYWLRINKAKNSNQKENRTWMYETLDQMAEFLGYLSSKQVRTAVNLLVEAGILIEGNFNQNKFDRTTWYAIFDETILEHRSALQGKSMRPTGQMDDDLVGASKITPRADDHIYNKNTKKNNNIEPCGLNEKNSSFSSKKEERIQHGSHVKLTPMEYNKLFTELGDFRLKDLIERVNDYCAANKPKGYSCYAAAIRNFAKNQKTHTQGFKNATNIKDDIRKRQMEDYTKANGSFEDGVLRFD